MDQHHQSLVPVFITRQLEHAANSAISHAPLTRVRLGKLRSKTLALELQKPRLMLFVRVGRGRLQFQNYWEETADVRLTGPAFGLLRQLTSRSNTPADLMDKGIEIQGNQELAQDFIALLRELDVDFEGILGDLIGDLAAHQISNLARGGLGWLKRSSRSLFQQSRQFLVNEQQLLVTPAEFNEFRQHVETLQEDSDRLQARIKRLHQHLAQEEDRP